MCHSPSGASRVQAPDLACWALADNATATESPAASPPDTTFCATRFITNLREKGDSPADFAPCYFLRIGRAAYGLVYRESRPGPLLQTDVQTLCWTGGPRSTVGSIHRRNALAIPEQVRVSEVRWMDWGARAGDRGLVARGWYGVREAESGEGDWHKGVNQELGHHITSGQHGCGAPARCGFDINELVPAN